MSQYPSQGRPSDGSRERHELAAEVEAALAARSELGPGYDDHIAAGLAERVEQLAALRTAELRHQGELTRSDAAEERTERTQRFVLALASIGGGIPVTAIAANSVDPGLLGIAVAWAGIIGVNVVHAWGHRRSR